MFPVSETAPRSLGSLSAALGRRGIAARTLLGFVLVVLMVAASSRLAAASDHPVIDGMIAQAEREVTDAELDFDHAKSSVCQPAPDEFTAQEQNIAAAEARMEAARAALGEIRKVSDSLEATKQAMDQIAAKVPGMKTTADAIGALAKRADAAWMEAVKKYQHTLSDYEVQLRVGEKMAQRLTGGCGSLLQAGDAPIIVSVDSPSPSDPVAESDPAAQTDPGGQAEDPGPVGGEGDIHRDSDGDGITDASELYDFGTDPYNPDTDFDGITDGDEVFTFGTNPLVGDAPAHRPEDEQESPPISTEIPVPGDAEGPGNTGIESDGREPTDTPAVNGDSTEPDVTDADGGGTTTYEEQDAPSQPASDPEADPSSTGSAAG